ncbi:MAG TPA: TolC family protein [Candidatus Kapabacteria bacterium]|nr:TolC family protein [Candidatus Kapabacteria bacterium]
MLCILCAARVAAQTDSLSLPQCIQRALQYNASVRVAQSDIRGAQLRHEEFGLTNLPFIAARSHVLWAPDNGYDPIITNGGEIAAQIGVDVPLYDGGVKSIGLDQSSVDIQRAERAKTLTERDITFETKVAYYMVLRAEHEYMLQQQSVAQLQDYLDLTKRLKAGGIADETDILKSQIQLNESQIALRESGQQIRQAKISLAELLGSGASPTIEIQDTSVLDTSDVPEMNVMQTLDEQVSQLAIQSAQYNITLAQTETRPRVSLSADVGALTSLDNLRAQSGLHNVFGYSALAELEIPLWNWGLTDRRAEEQQTALEGLKAQDELLQRSLISEWNAAREDFITAKESFENFTETVQSAEDNYILSKAQFTGGHGRSLEVLDAQRLLTDTKLGVEKSRADILIAKARLERLATK